MALSEQDARQSALGETVLKDLRQMELPAVPDFYKLWFTHKAGYDKDLSRAIRERTKQGKGLEADSAELLFREFCDNNSSAADATTSMIMEQVKQTVQTLEDVQGDTKSFGSNLSSTQTRLKQIDDPSKLIEIVGAIADQTASFAETTDRFAAELAARENEIHALQEALKEAQRASQTDVLTRVGNRRLFDEEIEKQLDVARETDQPMSLLLIDIDHFKKFNDTHGHQMGDVVLKMVAQHLKSRVKGRDIVARYGGEEFAIILPETGQHGAKILAEQIRAQLSANNIIIKKTGKNLGKVTLSIGISDISANTTSEQMISAADEALYRAKANGRNRVEMAA